VNTIAIDELIDQLAAEPFDVHRASRGEMAQRFLSLRGTEEPSGTASDRLAFDTFDIRATDWAMFW
jgi:hypothetical protein